MRSTSGAAAIEFAILAGPLVAFIVCILQIGLYYATQAALDNGVLRTAEQLRAGFTLGATATLPSAATVKSNVSLYSGGLIGNNASLAVEVRQLTTLSGGAVAITDGTIDYGSTTAPVVLRAKAKIIVFAPGFSQLTSVTSMAMVRRQGK